MAIRRARRPVPRRKLVWARDPIVDFGRPVPPGGFAVDLLASFRALGGETLGSTVTRCHLDVQTFYNDVGAGFACEIGYYCGLIIDQRNQPETEVPRPSTEEHADWMLWRWLPFITPDDVTTVVDGFTNHYMLDIRAQRKMEELGETLWFVVQPNPGDVLGDIRLASSVLLRLP